MVTEIHESLVNGNRKQMVEQIDDYATYDFWEDYKRYLLDTQTMEQAFDYFADATISYFRIKAR